MKRIVVTLTVAIVVLGSASTASARRAVRPLSAQPAVICLCEGGGGASYKAVRLQRKKQVRR